MNDPFAYALAMGAAQPVPESRSGKLIPGGRPFGVVRRGGADGLGAPLPRTRSEAASRRTSASPSTTRRSRQGRPGAFTPAPSLRAATAAAAATGAAVEPEQRPG